MPLSFQQDKGNENKGFDLSIIKISLHFVKNLPTHLIIEFAFQKIQF